MIRVDAIWLAVEPLDMRAGTECAHHPREQFDALVLGLPWQRIGDAGVISLL